MINRIRYCHKEWETTYIGKFEVIVSTGKLIHSLESQNQLKQYIDSMWDIILFKEKCGGFEIKKRGNN